MSRQKFQEELKTLEELRTKCDSCAEETLKFYCNCLMKMHRACYKIEETEMLSYVRQIVSPAFPLVIRYFVDRVKACIDETVPEDTKGIIRQDVEESVVEFGEVLEAIIHSTNGADRILLQTAPIDVGIRYAAPKLCAYYSKTLNAVAKLFQHQDENEYAFCVYPTLNSCAEALLLFSTMERRGKVGIIRIPGYQIADISYMRLLLLHEIFHVLPGALRMRKERARAFQIILLYSVENELIGKCKEISAEDRKRLEKFFFAEMVERSVRYLREKEEGDRIFYSRNISEYYVNEFAKQFYETQKKDIKDYGDCLDDGKGWETYEEYSAWMRRIRQLSERIQGNILRILANGELTEKCNCYMDLFREAYSDIMTIITLRLPPDMYFSGFHYAPDDEDDKRLRCTLYLRAMFVAKTMCCMFEDISAEQKKLFEMWRNWKNCCQNTETESFVKGVASLSEKYPSYTEKTAAKEKTEQETGSAVRILDGKSLSIHLNDSMEQKYMNYFKDCCREYLEYERKNHEKFLEFRKLCGISDDGKTTNLNFAVSSRAWENA